MGLLFLSSMASAIAVTAPAAGYTVQQTVATMLICLTTSTAIVGLLIIVTGTWYHGWVWVWVWLYVEWLSIFLYAVCISCMLCLFFLYAVCFSCMLCLRFLYAVSFSHTTCLLHHVQSSLHNHTNAYHTPPNPNPHSYTNNRLHEAGTACTIPTTPSRGRVPRFCGVLLLCEWGFTCHQHAHCFPRKLDCTMSRPWCAALASTCCFNMACVVGGDGTFQAPAGAAPAAVCCAIGVLCGAVWDGVYIGGCTEERVGQATIGKWFLFLFLFFGVCWGCWGVLRSSHPCIPPPTCTPIHTHTPPPTHRSKKSINFGKYGRYTTYQSSPVVCTGQPCLRRLGCWLHCFL